MTTQLSEHFTLDEFTYSATAMAKGIDNTPTSTHLKTLKHTCEYCLEVLRSLLNEKYGAAYISISSGYRSKKLNTAVGGVSTSQHCTGEAADIHTYYKVDGVYTKMGYTDLYKDIKTWVNEGSLSCDQCIQEQSGSSTWVHISHSASGKTKDRKQFLIFKNGAYTLDS